MAKSDEVEIKVTLVDKITGKAKKIKSEMGRTFDGIEQGAKRSQSSMMALAGPLGVAGLGIALLAVGKKAIDAKAKFETLELTFKAILGSTEKAKKRMRELAEFASSTPFKLEGIAESSKILETLTKGALSTGKGLRMVGDAAAIAGVPMEELSVHIGRAHSNLSNNRPAGESISRMQELGLIAGDTRNKIEELQKQARGTEAWELLQKSLEKNSGAMKDLANTFSGKLSTLMDKFDDFYRVAFNEGAFDTMKKGVDTLIESTEFWIIALQKANAIIGSGDPKETQLQILEKEIEAHREIIKLEKERIKENEKILGGSKASLIKSSNKKIAAAEKEIAAAEEYMEVEKQKVEIQDFTAKKTKEQTEAKAKDTKALSKTEQAAATQAIKDAETINTFDEQKATWREEVRKSDERKKAISEGEIEGYNLKIEKERELQAIGAEEREREQQAREAKDESDKKQDGLMKGEEKAKKKEKRNKELAKSEKKLEKEKQDAFIETITIKQKLAKTGFLFSKAMFGENKKLAITEAMVQGGLAIQKALASAPPPMNFVNAGLVGAQTAFNISKIRKAEKGADFTTDGPELLLVGDNAGGKENVSVTPVNTPNINGPKGDGGGMSFSMPVTIQGNADETTVNSLMQAGEKIGRMVEEVVRGGFVNLRTLDGQEIISV